MYVKKLWCHNCHYCNNRCLIREDHKANNWVTTSNRLRRRRSDAPRLWPAWRRLTFPFLSLPRKKVISLPQRPLCTIGNWREDNAGAGGGGGGGGWSAHADSAVATPRLVALWNEGKPLMAREMSAGFSGYAELRQPEIRCVRRLPLRRIEPSFEFARKVRSSCKFLQSKTTVKFRK